MNAEKVIKKRRKRKSTKIPDRWRDYTRCGVPIPGERIIVFKTPLSHKFDSKSEQDKKIKPHERFTPMDLENHVSQKNIKLKMVVDLTNTNADTYYNPKELCDHGIPHRKIKCVGKQIPDENVVERFKTAVCTFMKENSNSDSVVGVHCTHGVNRSGYVVCRYLIECKGYTPQDAIKAFNKTRGHHMEYTDHLEDLLEKKARLDFPSYVCIGDNRKWDEIPFEEDKTNWRSNNIRGNTKEFIEVGAIKHQGQPNTVNLTNPETLQLHRETRLAQLESAINMELWQEAFKAAEDVYGLMQLSKRPPKPQVMANYYQKVALVFWKAENYLFHACTLHRLYVLSKEQKRTMTTEEHQKMATRVVLATLAIPIPVSLSETERHLESDEIAREKSRRLASLLGLQTIPTRASLINDMLKLNVQQHIMPQLQDLFQNLEKDFSPLQFCSRVNEFFEFLQENEELELNQYITPLQYVAIVRLLKQVSQVYQTIEFSRLLSLLPFATEFQLEKAIVDVAVQNELQVRIDHRTKAVRFGLDLHVANKEEVPEGPYLQSMPSERLRNQLTLMSTALHKAITKIQPEIIKQKCQEEQQKIIQVYLRSSKKEHKQMLERKAVIEARKEYLESLHVKRMDYLARAMRVEEIPLLKQQYEEHLVQDQKFWEEQEEERISRAVSEHKKLVETSGRLQRMVSDKETFVDSLLKARQASHEEKSKEFQARLDDVRKKRLEERRKERILERKVQRRVEREEKERKEKEKREKRERKQAEEKARKEKEEKEREKVAKLDEMERKRREREKEIEEREQRASRPDSERDGPPRGLERDRNRDRWGPPRRDEKEEGGSWRRDERERPPPDVGRRREEREPPPPSRDQEEREQDRESTGGWRRGGDGRDDRYRDDRRDDRFRDDRFRDGSSGGGWRRDDRDREGPRDEGSSGRRSGKRDGPRRDMDRGRMDDRGPWRRDDRDRPPPGGGWRDSDDRDRPPPSFRDDRGRDDRWRDDRGREDRGREDRGREERGREDRGREDRWRIERGQDDRGRDDRGRDDRGRDDRGRDDRGRDDRSMAWRGRDREERDRPSGDSWRGDRDRGDRDRDRDDRYRGDREGDHSRGDRDDRERSGWRNERPDDRDCDRDAWRRGGDDAGRDQWRRDPPPARSEGKSWSASRRGRERPPAEQSDGDGWTTVQYK